MNGNNSIASFVINHHSPHSLSLSHTHTRSFGKATVPFIAKLALSLTSATFGLLTTAILSYVSSPYILRLTQHGVGDNGVGDNGAGAEGGNGGVGDDEGEVKFTAETYNVILRRKQHTFTLNEVNPVCM